MGDKLIWLQPDIELPISKRYQHGVLISDKCIISIWQNNWHWVCWKTFFHNNQIMTDIRWRPKMNEYIWRRIDMKTHCVIMGSLWRDPACHHVFVGKPEHAVRKQRCCQWVGVLWRPCDVTIITMSQNAISQIANSRADFGNILRYIYIWKKSPQLTTSTVRGFGSFLCCKPGDNFWHRVD